MMGRHFSRDRSAISLGSFKGPDAAPGAHVADVVAAPCGLTYGQIPYNLKIFREGMDAFVLMFSCIVSLMDVSTKEHGVFLAVGGDDAIKLFDAFHGLIHEPCTLNAFPVIGEA